jgi:hypothetical protein
MSAQIGARPFPFTTKPRVMVGKSIMQEGSSGREQAGCHAIRHLVRVRQTFYLNVPERRRRAVVCFALVGTENTVAARGNSSSRSSNC